MPEQQFWTEVEEILEPPVTKSGARANRPQSYRDGTFSRKVRIAVVANDNRDMRVELSSSDAQRNEVLRAIGRSAQDRALTLPPGGDVPATRNAPKNPDKVNLEFVWRRTNGYTPELPRVRDFVQWFHEVARELVDTVPELSSGADPEPNAETSAGTRWRLRSTRFALSGWHEHPDAAHLRRYAATLVGPILDAWKSSPDPEAVKAGVKWTLNQVVWAYTTLHDLAKYDTRFISERATPPFETLERAQAARKLTEARRKILPKLRHEHVHTRSDVVQRLLGGDVTVLEREADACVVTVEDHDDLDDAPGVGWERYANAGIRVWDRSKGNWVTLR